MKKSKPTTQKPAIQKLGQTQFSLEDLKQFSYKLGLAFFDMYNDARELNRVGQLTANLSPTSSAYEIGKAMGAMDMHPRQHEIGPAAAFAFILSIQEIVYPQANDEEKEALGTFFDQGYRELNGGIYNTLRFDYDIVFNSRPPTHEPTADFLQAVDIAKKENIELEQKRQETRAFQTCQETAASFGFNLGIIQRALNAAQPRFLIFLKPEDPEIMAMYITRKVAKVAPDPAAIVGNMFGSNPLQATGKTGPTGPARN